MIYTVTLNPTIDRTLVLDGNLILGDVNRGNLTKVAAGGKGINCAQAACGMGSEAVAYCFIGKDNIEEFEKSTVGLNCDIRAEYKKGLTRTCLKVYANNGLTTEFNEYGSRLSAEEMKPFIARLIMDIQKEGKPEFIVLSGSVPPGVESGIYAGMIALFKKLGIPTMLDCDGETLRRGIESSPYLVKPNLSEFEAYCGGALQSIPEIIKNAKEVAQKYDTRLLVTIGGDGMIYADKEVCYRVTVPEVNCSTTVGAGDTVFGVLAAALSKGLSMEKSLQLAGAAACAKVVGQPGAFPVQSDVLPYLPKVSVMKWEEPETELTEDVEKEEESDQTIDFEKTEEKSEQTEETNSGK
ncbi:MAG: 1-phosphofructokinase family hexose kinase [Ruminococcaceae bacterium]|nr:1-phosphofructokinase family hexose kinase [Oscillospiraceae bacterium]